MNISKNEILLIYNSNNLQDREALAYAKTLQKHKLKELDVQKDNLSPSKFKEISEYLGRPLEDLIDKNSTIYNKEYKQTALSDEGILKALENHQEILKTPILISKNKAKFLDSAYEFIKEDMTLGDNKSDPDISNEAKLE